MKHPMFLNRASSFVARKRHFNKLARKLLYNSNYILSCDLSIGGAHSTGRFWLRPRARTLQNQKEQVNDGFWDIGCASWRFGFFAGSKNPLAGGHFVGGDVAVDPCLAGQWAA